MSASPVRSRCRRRRAPRWRWLPPPGTWQYHALLLALGILVLGPLGGLTAAYMNFSIGFFVGGQVLAGLLGSTVTYGYGAEGKHGANYIQTAAASVAGMSAMGVLIQAMVWLGLPQPPMWQLVLYMLTIGMFGAGIGMLYTPILVDRMKLVFPSGLAVANILRALTDPVLLRRSVALLGGGVASGLVGGVAAAKVAILGTIELSTSTFGAGMVVGARIGLAAVTGGVLGLVLKPYFVSIGWLQAGDPPRKIMFLIGLGWIMGAAIVDMGLILGSRRAALARDGGAAGRPGRVGDVAVHGWRRVHTVRLVIWSICWGAAVVAVGHLVLHQPVLYLVVALAARLRVRARQRHLARHQRLEPDLVGLRRRRSSSWRRSASRIPAVGLMAGTVLLVSTSVACDMQQDRSTGARLGTDRVMQFRYQVAGIFVGALLAVGFARLFMAAYPVLLLDQTVMSEGAAAGAMERGDDLQVRRHPEEPDRRQAVPAHGDLDRRRHGPPDRAGPQALVRERALAALQEDAHRRRGRLRPRLDGAVVAVRAVVRRLRQPGDVALARRRRHRRQPHRRARRARKKRAARPATTASCRRT